MDAAVQFPTTPKAAKAAALHLSKRMSLEQSFEAIMRNGIEQILENEVGVTRFHDMESLHQMRVGVRRLRAALAMFDEVLRSPEEIALELVWLMDQLGPARDWDVLLTETLPQVEDALPGNPALAGVRDAVQQARLASHEQVAREVSSLRFKRLVKHLEQWVDQRGWRDGLSPKGKTRLKMHAVDFADTVLAAEQQRLLKRGSKLKGATPEQRHRVRIAAKRARYAAEFFASVYPARRVRPYLGAMAGLQRQLGLLNDGEVARKLVCKLCAGNDGLREGGALVCGYLACGEQRGGQQLGRWWKRHAPVAPF
ncbi:CHAD domain-containing protein [Massilia sp. TSP1-1-2]|uniref:CHAD domain-containing protein n=1 Tax=Massilia sp. TSP1-1-2 TaxID=2804649 RepID=UPI003CFA058D